MRINSKSLNRILLFVLCVLLLTVLMQISRSDLLLQWNLSKESQHTARPEIKNALTAEEMARLETESFLIIYDSRLPLSEKIKWNAEQVLTAMKKSFRGVEVGQLHMTGEHPTAIIVTLSDWTDLLRNDWIDSYVRGGGRVLFATAPENNDALFALYRKLDVLEVGGYLDTSEVHLQTSILPGFADQTYKDQALLNTVLRVKLGEKAIIHATAGNGLPLLWEVPYEKGSFAVFNGTILQDKVNRGLFSGAISVLIPDFIYPIMNAKVMYIDDFPAPFPQTRDPALFRDYHMDVPSFFKRVWWPDMIRLARSYDLKYTGVLIATYNDRVSPPFDWTTEVDKESLITYGRELLRDGGELGIHGYNHQSLTSQSRKSDALGYKTWNGEREMYDSLVAVRDYVHSIFPNHELHTYVPPSNTLDEEGRKALKRALPDLKNISSLYGEDPHDISYIQEYGIGSDGIIDLPRVTYGYQIGTYEKWMMANAVASVGVFSHFVHPDDILDQQRSNDASWSEMYENLEGFLRQVKERAGWLRSMTASDASDEAERWIKGKPVFEYRDNALFGYINHFTGMQYFLLRSDKKVRRLHGCEIQKIDSDVYLIKANQEKFSIEWMEGK